MVILDYIGNQTIHCSFKNDVHVTYSRNLRWSEPITFQYYSLAPTWSYCIVCHYGSTQNSAVNHLAPTQCPYLARLVLQILEPSCTQLLSNGCNLTTMMSLPGPLSGAIFSANPGCNYQVFFPWHFRSSDLIRSNGPYNHLPSRHLWDFRGWMSGLLLRGGYTYFCRP